MTEGEAAPAAVAEQGSRNLLMRVIAALVLAPTAIATEGDLPTRLILHAIVISVRSAKRGSAWSAPAFGAAPEEVRPLRAGMQALAESLVHSIDQTS